MSFKGKAATYHFVEDNMGKFCIMRFVGMIERFVRDLIFARWCFERMKSFWSTTFVSSKNLISSQLEEMNWIASSSHKQ